MDTIEDKVFQLDNGRYIVAHWDNYHQQFQTYDCLPGYIKAFAGTVERLARETGRTYKNKSYAVKKARSIYHG